MLSLARFSSPARIAVRLLFAAGLAGLATFALAAAFGDAGASGFQVLYVCLPFVFGALCILRAALIPSERVVWALFGIGMLFFGGGYAYYFRFLQHLDSPPYPSVADAHWITYTVLLFVGVMLLVRARLLGLRRALWADVVVGAMALAAVAAALLVDPLIASTGGSVGAVATGLAYPLLDLLIISVVLGVFALGKWRLSRTWALIGCGLMIQATGDVTYLYQVAGGTYEGGTLLDLTFPTTMSLFALAAWQKPVVTRSRQLQGATALAIAAGFALIGLILIAFDHVRGINDVAFALAMLTLVAAFARAAKTYADVSKRSLIQNESILNAAGDGIYGLSPEGRITFVNPAAAKLTGYEPDELVGREAHATLHHSRADDSLHPPEECPITATLEEGVTHEGSEDIYWRQDGSSFPIEFTSTPLRENTGAVVVFKDVTERREVERMKDEFISVVSHELRTPLTSIRGSLGLLQSGTLGELPDKGRRMVEIAVSNTDRLVRLINDILDIERIESGRVTMETRRWSTADLAGTSVEAVGSMAREAGVRIETSVQADEVMVDGDRVIQVLTNLLSNAVKFSPRGSVVRLSSKRQDEQVGLTVSDEGRGIPADRLESIFERFQQVDASDARQKGGTGLGLAIARTIVQQHGGEIWAESTEGRGSSFHFTLPLAGPARMAVAEHHGAGGRVLICDDDPSVVEVISSMVRERGYTAIPATSGREAVELALKETPDVVVLDMLMPEMSGWEVAAALNERAELAEIPLVILSVLAANETEQPEDVVEWLEKPPSEEALFRALETALASRGERPRVLIVEDDLDLAGVLTETFERRGLEAFHAVDGGEAIELSDRIRPDLLVLDLVLPRTDGFEVVDWLRHHDRLKCVPIMVYTAKDLDAEERHRLQGPGTQVFTKSRVPPDQFEQRVMQLLDKITARSRTETNGAEANPGRR